MKIKPFLVMAALMAVALPACDANYSDPTTSSASQSASVEPEGIVVNCPITLFLSDEAVEQEFPFVYKSSFFNNPTQEFDKGMAMFACGMALSTKTLERAEKAYNGFGFGDCFEAVGMATSSNESIGYLIGEKDEDGVNQIVVTVRGEGYDEEWYSNLYAVPEIEVPDYNGDHYSMSKKAKEVYAEVKNFIAKNNIENPRILFTGYSRGASVASLAAALCIDDGNVSNTYAYTFEAPAAMLSEHNKAAYDAIHNLVNENDLVPMLLPSAYGFVRPGQTHYTATGLTDIGALCQSYGIRTKGIDESIDFYSMGLKDEEGNSDYSAKRAYSFLLGLLSRELSEKEVGLGLKSYHTVEEYATNLQPYALEAMDFFFSMLPRFGKDFSVPLAETFEFVTSLAYNDGYDETPREYNPDALYAVVRKVFSDQGFVPNDEDNPDDLPVYDAAKVRRFSAGLQDAFRSLHVGMTTYYVNQGKSIDAARGMLVTTVAVFMSHDAVVSRHATEVIYALARNYCEA